MLRAEALRNLAWRIDLIQMSSFCATLIAADSVGASIGPILKNLSNEIRQKKSAQVEKDGATAATKNFISHAFYNCTGCFYYRRSTFSPTNVYGAIMIKLICKEKNMIIRRKGIDALIF